MVLNRFCVALWVVWHCGKWICDDPMFGTDLVAEDLDGNSVSLHRLCHHEATEMLGIWMVPEGNSTKLVNSLKQKA